MSRSQQPKRGSHWIASFTSWKPRALSCSHQIHLTVTCIIYKTASSQPGSQSIRPLGAAEGKGSKAGTCMKPRRVSTLKGSRQQSVPGTFLSPRPQASPLLSSALNVVPPRSRTSGRVGKDGPKLQSHLPKPHPPSVQTPTRTHFSQAQELGWGSFLVLLRVFRLQELQQTNQRTV